MDLVPAIFLLVVGAVLLFIGFYFNREEDPAYSQNNMQVLRKEINALRDEIRRNDAKNDLVQREILLVREALPEGNGNRAQVAASSEDTIRGVFEPRFDVLGDKLTKHDDNSCQGPHGKQGPSQDVCPNQDQQEDSNTTQGQDTIMMLYNKYKRA